MSNIIYPELSYIIVGVCIEVFKELGGGYQEKYYQKAIEQVLIHEKLNYKRELVCELSFKEKSIGRYFLDFEIDEKVILEIKVGRQIYKRDILQVLS